MEQTKRKTPMLPKPEERKKQALLPIAAGGIAIAALLIIVTRLFATPTAMQINRAGAATSAPLFYATSVPTGETRATVAPTAVNMPPTVAAPSFGGQPAPMVIAVDAGADVPAPPTPTPPYLAECQTLPGARPCWLAADAAWDPLATVPETPIVLVAATNVPLVFADSACAAWRPPLAYPEGCGDE